MMFDDARHSKRKKTIRIERINSIRLFKNFQDCFFIISKQPFCSVKREGELPFTSLVYITNEI